MTFSSCIKHRWFVLALCFLLVNGWAVWRLVGTPTGVNQRAEGYTNEAPRIEALRLMSASMASYNTISNGFMPREIDASSPSFEPAVAQINFGREVDVREAAGFVEVSPSVKWELGPYYGGCSISGDFQPGKTYAITFKKGFKAGDGTLLATNVTRQVVFPDRAPALSIAVEGSYLSPRGALNVPVVTMNIRQCEVALRQICPGNVVFYANDPGRRKVSYEGLTSPAVTNTVSLPESPNRENKFYVNLRTLAGAEPKGVYCLAVTYKGQDYWDRREGTHLVVVTDLGISAKVAGNGVWVWVNSLRTATPATNTEVVLYARNNQELGRGMTDGQGLIFLPLKENLAPELEPTLVTAAFDGDLSYLPLQHPTTGVSLESSEGAPYLGRGHEAYVFTDRGVYRPGEAVHAKTLVRDASLMPPTPFPLIFRVLKPDGKVYRDVPVMLDILGAAELAMELPAYLPTGRYAVQVVMPGSFAELGSQTISLEDFVPPQIVATLSNLPQRVTSSDTVNVAVSARHLFGRPAAGLPVSAEVYFSDVPFKPANWEGYGFGDSEKAATKKTTELGSTHLDGDGKQSFLLEAMGKLRPAGPIRAAACVTVRDSSGRAVSTTGITLVDAYPYYVGLKPARVGGHIKVGDPLSISVAVVKPDGTVTQPESPLLTTVERVEWNSVMKRRGGHYSWESERIKTKVGESGKITLKNGEGQFPVTVDRSGEYIVTVSDPFSGASTSLKLFAAAGDAEWVDWAKDKPAGVQLSFDRTDYLPGEKAKLAVKAPFIGSALLTVESDRVLERRVVNLTGNTAEFEVEVKPEYAPNVHCVISLIRPASAESVWSAHRAAGSAVLKVVSPGHRLDVSIEAPKIIRPQSQLAVKVKAADETGKAVAGAEVVVMAVDEGICLLTDFETPDPLAYFVRTRGLGVTLADLYSELMPVSEDTSDATVSHTGGDGGSLLRRRLNPIKASRFKPVALWKSGVITDVKGEATMVLDVPELTGELRVTAVAYNRTAFGSTKEPVTVKRPLVVQAGLPRFLAPGDRCRMSLAVFNETGSAVEAKWRVTCGGPLRAEAVQGMLPLKAGGDGMAPVMLVAGEKPGKALCTVEVTAGTERYAETFELAVRPILATESRSVFAAVKPGDEARITVPAGWLAGTEYYEAWVSGQPDLKLKGGLDWLLRYPYGCCEQTVSSAFPLLYLADLVARTRPQGLGEDTGHFVMAGVYRVLSMQVSSGGFSLWPDYREENPWASIYATHFLVEAKKAGHPVPEDRLNAALDYLRESLERRDSENRAYICQVLALAGRPEQGWVSRLVESAGELSPADRAHLAAALLAGGKPREAVSLLNDLGVPAGTVERDGYGSRTRDIALALSAWLDIEPGNEMVLRLIRELEGLRVADKGWWGTTQENALALMALGKFARLTKPDKTPFAGELIPAGLAAVPFQSGKDIRWVSKEPGTAKELRVVNRGPGTCWYGVRMEGVPVAGDVKPYDKGISVRREFLKPDGSIMADIALNQGDLVVIKLSLDAHGEAMENLVIEDLLPAGWEVENPALATSKTLAWVKADTGWCIHRELRDDRFLLFTGAVSGKVEYYYTVRAVTPGRFVLPPVRVEAMYRPEIGSLNGAGVVEVVE
ncbi:MAG: MG2 domain-containing protein [bacterium]